MELYGQETEVALLGAYGYGPAHLIEPEPANVAELRRVFGERSDVEILDIAAGASDGEATLYLAREVEEQRVAIEQTEANRQRLESELRVQG